MSTLQVELVAADRKVWAGEASMVRARSIEGDLGILPGHSPMLGILVKGEVAISTGGSTEQISVDGGFLSVDHDRVTIVVDQVVESTLSQSAAE